MIKINPGQMEAVCQDLCEMSAQLNRIEGELEEVWYELRKLTPLNEILYQLKKEETRLQERRYQAIQLRAALEQITAVYCRTETEIDEILEADVRRFASFETAVMDFGKLTFRINRMWK